MEIANINQLKKGENIIRKERNKENPYAQIYKGIINDRNISYKALGIATYILSKPSDWEVYISDLIRENCDAEKSVRSGIKELIQRGYMQRYPVYVNGLVYCWRTLLSETPYEDYENVKNIKLVSDDNGNVISEEITYKNNRKLLSQNGEVVDITQIELLAQNVKVDNVHVDNVLVENEGLLINDITNNDLTDNYVVVLEAYSKAINHKLTEAEKDKLKDLCNSYSNELILKAIDMTVEQAEHFNIKYIRTILERFKAKGLNTLEELETFLKNDNKLNKNGIHNKANNSKNNKDNKNSNSINSFMNRKQATYDIAAIERKLLGWDNAD